MNSYYDLNLIQAAFKEFDADDNGVFDAYEFRNALNNVGMFLNVIEILC